MSVIDRLPERSASLQLALALIDRGLSCFPCRADKRPTTPRGYKDAARDSRVLRELWRHHPGPLIGVPTGDVSDMDVLDIDPRHGGNLWFSEHKLHLPATRVHQTRNGEPHLLFQHESSLRCSAGRIAAGIDVRATGATSSGGRAPGFQWSLTCQLRLGRIGCAASSCRLRGR